MKNNSKSEKLLDLFENLSDTLNESKYLTREDDKPVIDLRTFNDENSDTPAHLEVRLAEHVELRVLNEIMTFGNERDVVVDIAVENVYFRGPMGYGVIVKMYVEKR